MKKHLQWNLSSFAGACCVLVVCAASTAWSAPVLPTSISGNVLWLHAAAGQTGSVGNGNPVSSWLDASTLNTNDASQSGSARPLWIADGGATFNNLPVVRFDGAAQHMLIPDSSSLEGTTGMTWFFVSRQDAETGDNALLTKWNHGVATTYAIQSAGSGLYRAYIAQNTNAPGDVNGTTTTSSFTSTVANMLTVQFDGAGSGNADRLKMFANTVSDTMSFNGTIPSSLVDSAASAAIGAFTGALTRYWDGDIAEIIMFNRVLSDGSVSVYDNELNDVQYYLDNKYNLGLDLQETPFLAPVVVPVPEPATLWLLLLGGMAIQRGRNRRRTA